MRFAYHALVLDYDGTLTLGGRPAPRALEALARAGAAGRKRVLATGRILSELQAEFPDVESHFDALVLENGAVVRTALGHRLTMAPVPTELDAALRSAGVAFRRGEAILATDAGAATAALEAIGRLGLDCQLVRNRGELMILPAGVSKGMGAREALGDLGVSFHCAIGAGDAENDLALLDACEVGVAVANAVGALKARADVVLGETDGAAIATLVDGALVRGELSIRPKRWQVELGAGARVPGSGVNLLIAGESGCGKSHLAGMFAERLIQLGYSICVIDPEGDYESLAHLRGVRVVGGSHELPEPGELPALLRHRFGSLVVDLSHLPPAARLPYQRAALAVLQAEREATGSPHWTLVDEAHVAFAADGGAPPVDPAQKGLCLVTYLPGQLDPRVLEGTDLFLFPLSPGGAADPEMLALAGARPPPKPSGAGRHAVLVDGRGGEPVTFELLGRRSAHVRHWHKYMRAQLPAHLQFLFRAPNGQVLGAAGNVSELHHDLVGVSGASIAHHAAAGDFSRWAGEALQDTELAEALARAEQRLSFGTEAARHALLEAVEQRYLERGPQAPPRLGSAG